MNATDLMTQQQYADLFNKHFDPMQISLNRLNNNTRQLNNDFNTFGNENLAALGKQRANMKNMITTMQVVNTTMQGLDALMTQNNNNRNQEAQAIINQ